MADRTFKAELVEMTHDGAGLKLAPGQLAVRFTIDDGKPFDMPIEHAKHLSLDIVDAPDAGLHGGRPFILVEAHGFGPSET